MTYQYGLEECRQERDALRDALRAAQGKIPTIAELRDALRVASGHSIRGKRAEEIAGIMFEYLVATPADQERMR